MTTTGLARLAWVEACRGLAATAVLVYHVVRHFDKNYGLPSFEHVVQFGHAGVDLFFVLSGFIILFVHFDDIGKPSRIRRYLERRLTRILPTYWVAVALTLGMVLAGGHTLPLSDIVWGIFPLPITSEPIVGVAWTLQYEFVFYTMFAVLILNRMAGIAVMSIWLFAIIFSALWTVTDGVPPALYGLSNLEFFAGMAVAYRLRIGQLARYKAILVAGIVLFCGCAVAEDLAWMDGYGSFGRLAYGLACSLIILGVTEASRRGATRVPHILRMLGSASYSLYLFQFVFIGLAWKLWLATGFDTTVSPITGCAVFGAIAVVGGVIVSRSVEYPLMRLIRDAIGEGASRKAVSAAAKVPVI